MGRIPLITSAGDCTRKYPDESGQKLPTDPVSKYVSIEDNFRW